MQEVFEQDERPRLLWPTIKVVAAIAAISVLAANYLSHGALDQGTLSRLTAQALGEPTMTGSIGRAAGATKLDPCGDSRKR